MKRTLTNTLSAAALALSATALSTTAALASPETYKLDASHSQVIFSYNHFGYSTTYGMFSGFEGEILFDENDPAASSVYVSMPLMSMFTGWEQREAHFMSDEFFDASEDDMITFTSTDIEVTGEDTALITGDLSIAGVTQSVVLDARLNQQSPHPMENRPWLGFDATTTLKRSDFEVGAFAPMVSDEVEVMISLEAGKPEE